MYAEKKQYSWFSFKEDVKICEFDWYISFQNTGVNETLVEEGPFTVLAPSDHVFNMLPKIEFDHLMENPELQEQLVKLHVLRGKLIFWKLSSYME